MNLQNGYLRINNDTAEEYLYVPLANLKAIKAFQAGNKNEIHFYLEGLNEPLVVPVCHNKQNEFENNFCFSIYKEGGECIQEIEPECWSAPFSIADDLIKGLAKVLINPIN